MAAGISACGDDESDPQKPAAEQPQSSPPASVVRVGVGGPVRFDKKRYTAKAGSVRIELDNTGRIGHNARLQPAGKPCCTEHDIGGTNTISGGESHAATVELKPGRYIVYCSIGGHWQRGMRAPLLVE